MPQPLGPVKDIEPPNVPPTIPVLGPATCKEEIGEILAGYWYTNGPSWGNLPTWTATAIQLPTCTV